MEFQKLSSHRTQSFQPITTTVGGNKGPISSICDVPRHCIEIVNKDEGIIYDDSRDIQSLPRPLEVMVGRAERSVPDYLNTTDPDMILQDPSDEEPRLKMSCGHAITPDNLFGHMRHSLIDVAKDKITCLTSGCEQEWDFGEVSRKAAMTDDEVIFYSCKISRNAVFSDNSDISECPECGQICQRQKSTKAVRCTLCSKRKTASFDFCWDCKSPWVANHECVTGDLEAVQKILNEAPLKTLDYSNIERVPSKRLCPGCRTIIEHDSLCKQMTCLNCKLGFCFSCLTVCDNGILQCSGYNRMCNVAPVQNAFD